MKQKRRSKDILVAYSFLSPALITFAALMFVPILAVIYLSLTQYDMLSPLKYNGLENYKKLIHDPAVIKSYISTFKMVAIIVPLHLVVGLLLALAASRKISDKLKFFYRTVFYFPVLVTTSAVAVAWIFIYHNNFGILNYFLNLVGMPRIPWLNSSFWVFIAIGIFSIWKFGGQTFLYYLIGIQGVPKEVLEAAEIDGANRIQKFFYVTLPMISPTVFFVLVVLLIGATQIFDEPYILTKGGPGDSTKSINLYIYELAYQFANLGYASTVAFSLFAVILIGTLLVFWIGQKFVHYNN